MADNKFQKFIEKYIYEFKQIYLTEVNSGQTTAELSYRPALDNLFRNIPKLLNNNSVEIIFEPTPVQNDMDSHQDDKHNSQVKMDITPFVAGHWPEVFYVLSAETFVEPTTASACAGRQNIFHNKAGENYAKQIEKTD